MKTTIEKITPARAKAMLEANPVVNRRINRRHVEYLKREMLAGRWRLTHHGIAITEEGSLVDGQHRLIAVVESGVTVQMMMSTGVDREVVLAGVDQGKIRNRSQLLTMRGESNPAQKSAICRGISILITPGLPYTASLGPSGDEEILDRYRASIEAATEHVDSGKRLPGQYLAVVALMHDTDTLTGTDFGTGVRTGADLEVSDPRLTLRNWLIARSPRQTSGVGLISRCLSAADAFVHQEPLGRVTPSRIRYERFAKWANIPVNKSIVSAIES